MKELEERVIGYGCVYSGFIMPVVAGKSCFDIMMLSKEEDKYYPELEHNLMVEGSDFEVIREVGDETPLQEGWIGYTIAPYKDSFVAIRFMEFGDDGQHNYRLPTQEEIKELLTPFEE